MYSCKKFKNIDINKFRELNKERCLFNNLNDDFFSYYDKVNMLEKFLVMKKVLLLEEENTHKYIGYLWTYKLDTYKYKIKCFYIIEEYKDHLDTYKELLNHLDNNYTYVYNCEKDDFNYTILEKLGFKKEQGIYEMEMSMNNTFNVNYSSEITFKRFKTNKDETLRCSIQNTIFENDNRIPLTVEDIYFEESQDYFYDEGCFFAKNKDNYIGYVQVIFEENNIPCIVNFGIVPEFRNRGYGKQLLIFLLNTLYQKGFDKFKIKVSSNNYPALELYKKLNFLIVKENFKWEWRN